FAKKSNVYCLVGGNTGAQMGGWFRKDIKTVDDLKGLKFRIGGWAGKTLQKLGVVPQQIAGGDIYPALEKGTIDAAEWVGPYDDEKLGFYKVAPYYFYPGWWEGGTALHFLINQAKWDELPKSYQAIVTAAAAFANVEATARYDARNPAALKRLIGAGTHLRPFPQPIMEAMPERRWRLTSSFPTSLDTLYGAAEAFAKAVAEATDNKFQIQVFAAGEIVPGLQAADAVQSGTVEMCHTASYYYFGKDTTFAFGTSVPFGLNSRMQTAWMSFGGGMELMNDFYKKFNIYGIPAGNTGAQMGGWFRKEIKELSDLNGLKMRIGGFAGRVISKLG